MGTPEQQAKREYARQRDKQITDALGAGSGSVEDILAELGITNEHEHGRAKYNQYTGILRDYGTDASTNGIYDWVNGQYWDPLQVTQGYGEGQRQVNDPGNPNPQGNTGAWRPISADERASYARAQDLKSRYGDNVNPWRINTMEGDLRKGNVMRDPVSGMLVDYDPSRGTTYFDDQYRAVKKVNGPPTGWNPNGTPPGANGPFKNPTSPTSTPGTGTSDAQINSRAAGINNPSLTMSPTPKPPVTVGQNGVSASPTQTGAWGLPTPTNNPQEKTRMGVAPGETVGSDGGAWGTMGGKGTPPTRQPFTPPGSDVKPPITGGPTGPRLPPIQPDNGQPQQPIDTDMGGFRRRRKFVNNGPVAPTF